MSEPFKPGWADAEGKRLAGTKPAAYQAPTQTGAKPTKMKRTPEQCERMAAAQRARWAKKHSEGQ